MYHKVQKALTIENSKAKPTLNTLANQKKRFNDAINQRHFKIIQPSRLKHTKLLLLISSKEQSTT